jgi:carbonic anhydrase
MLFVIGGMVSGVFILSAVKAQDGHSVHWSYEGEEGPEHWGALDETFALCSEGHAQSPIDLTAATGIDLVNIDFDYHETVLNIFNNGHTVQVNYDSGSSITYNETTYDLLQFHLHHPSEHTVDGELAAMELHLVHRDGSGNLAVVGILIVESEEDNEDYAIVFDNLPAEEGEPAESELVVDAAELLPDSATFFTYSGSLTTPPCSQGVRWLVLDTPVELSETQIEAFAAIFELNARPTQDLNRRDLLSDTE